MQQPVDAIRVALRVLVALAERRQPRPEDVEQLRQLAPEGEYGSIDEMACLVVNEAIERYRQKQQASSP